MFASTLGFYVIPRRRLFTRNPPNGGSAELSSGLAVANKRDAFLIKLYQLFPGAPPGEFSAAALAVLNPLLPFDTALWGTFALTARGPSRHTVYLHGLPMEMLPEADRLYPHNLPLHEAARRPGRTVNVSMDRVEDVVHPDAVAFGRRWGLIHTLTTMVAEAPLNLFSIVCLYRSDPRNRFSERERRLKQSVAPHLVAAWRMNAMHFLDGTTRPARSIGSARVLVAENGEISTAEPGLADLLRAETREWRGPLLADALLPLARGDVAEYKGRAVVASRVRTLDDGAVVLSVRRRVPVDGLSARELEVAREFASGKSHKEIAALCGTSPQTVRSQIRAAYAKLGVTTKVELLKQIQASG